MGRYRENAGYVIIETHIFRDTDRWEGYVLGHKPDSDAYVTWYFLVRDGVWVYNLGHYFDAFNEATRDFHLRIADHYAG